MGRSLLGYRRLRAGVAELVDAPGLGPGPFGGGGSTPLARTLEHQHSPAVHFVGVVNHPRRR